MKRSRPTPSTAASPRSSACRQHRRRCTTPTSTRWPPSAVREAENADEFLDRARDEAGRRGRGDLRGRGGPPHPPRRAAGRAGVRPAPPADRHRRRQHRDPGRRAGRDPRRRQPQARRHPPHRALLPRRPAAPRRGRRVPSSHPRRPRPDARARSRGIGFEVAVGCSGTIEHGGGHGPRAPRGRGRRRTCEQLRDLRRPRSAAVGRRIAGAARRQRARAARRARPEAGRHHPRRRADPRAGGASRSASTSWSSPTTPCARASCSTPATARRARALHHLRDLRRRSVRPPGRRRWTTTPRTRPGRPRLALQLFDELQRAARPRRRRPRAARGRRPAGQRRPVRLPRQAPQAQLLRDPQHATSWPASPTTRSS